MTIDGVPLKLGYYMVDAVNTTQMNLKVHNGVIPITVESLHRSLGLPTGGIDLANEESLDVDDNLTLFWRRQFINGRMTPHDIINEIRRTKVGDIKFMLNFLVLVVNTLGECSRTGQCKTEFLKKITGVHMIPEIDWSKYIYDCIPNSKTNWKRENSWAFYAGPLTFLMMRWRAKKNQDDKGILMMRTMEMYYGELGTKWV
ncbi:hypothetical protein L6452_34466 [Arctium lappa]|uniref:Uncharacterized protein n=1 Tax=Arctium lappa TaxID=4217 RepID=A0ACB8YIJ7_ARCLA|nr:hypothetical protein L6452_34466 [Arctium lappa]